MYFIKALEIHEQNFSEPKVMSSDALFYPASRYLTYKNDHRKAANPHMRGPKEGIFV